MLTKPFKPFKIKLAQKASLKTVLIIPFLLQIVISVGLVGYLSFRNGQKAVGELAGELMQQISDRTRIHLQEYLETPAKINQSNARALGFGWLNHQDVLALKRHFWNQSKTFNSVTFIYFGNPQGGLALAGYNDQNQLIVRSTEGFISGKYYKYEMTPQGELKPLPEVKIFDARQRPWFQAALKAQKLVWSQVYPLFSTQTPGLTLSQPVYSQTGTFLGVLGVDISLEKTSQFLQRLKVGKSGYTFILEHSGELIASSTGETPFIKTSNEQVAIRVRASDSQNPLTRSSTQYLEKYYKNLNLIKNSKQLTFIQNNKRYFLQVTPIKSNGLDWLIVVVVPESDYMKQINANTQTTIILCISTLIIAVIVGILITRWISKPVLALNKAAKEIAQGNWHKVINIKRYDEIGQLAESFNQMATDLQKTFAELQSLNEDLSNNEKKLKQFLEGMPVGIGVWILDAEGQPYYFNNKAIELLGKGAIPDVTIDKISQVYQNYIAGTEDLYPVEDLPIVKALHGETSRVDNIEIHQGDRVISIEVWGTPIYNNQGQVIYGLVAFQDITKRKEAEKLLSEYSHTLEQQVTERTAELLRIFKELEQKNKQLTEEVKERKRVEYELEQLNQELEKLAKLDGLTQVANRYYFNQYIDQEWKRLQREQKPLALILCDVDYFKPYNDNYGHLSGDICLQKVANAMKNIIHRPADLVARYGGEEFVIVLPNTTLSGAITLAQKLQTKIRELKLPHHYSKVSKYVTISMGISSQIPTADTRPENLIHRADQALFQAKEEGRDRWIIDYDIPDGF